MDEKRYGEMIDSDTLLFRRVLQGTVEQVWSYLTESEKRGEWLASGEMELRVGGRVELHFDNSSLSEAEEEIPEKYREFEESSSLFGRITRLEPPRLLSHTWAEETGEESEVTYELSPEDEGVLLELTHRRLGDNRDLHLGVLAGWHTHLDILEDRLRGRSTKGFWSVHMALEEEYDRRLS